MLNHNEGVKLLAEPIGPLAPLTKNNQNKTESASLELQTIITKVEELVRNSPALGLVGFNEKLLSPKFSLPSQYTEMLRFASYLQHRNFK